MGTKFEYPINLLRDSPINSSRSKTKTFSFHYMDDREKSRNGELTAERRTYKRGIHSLPKEEQVGEPMDRSEETRNVESIRKTMQMHENIFRQQVRDLHRLYNVQKMLMAEVKKQIDHKRILVPQTTTASSMTNKSSISLPYQVFRTPGSDLSPSPRNFDTIKGAIPSGGRELGDGCSIEEHEVQLTLSLGGKMSKRKPRIEEEKKLISSLSVESNRGGPAPDNNGSTGTSDRERKRPHWLFQV